MPAPTPALTGSRRSPDQRMTSRWWTLGAPIAVLVLAAVLRLQNLGHPASLMFDETFYVKDAWTIWNLGYEGSWPGEDPNAAFNAGDVDGFTDQASYPAHPPLGKWLIALGMAALGASDPASWRLSAAIAGIVAVALVMLITRALWRDPVVTLLAGSLFAIDGHAIVLSRIGLLDNFLMLFGLLGFGAVLLDRRSVRRGLEGWPDRPSGGAEWGPVLWRRPWLVAAGAAFGLASAVKWSGLYFLAGFAIYVLVSEALARRDAGVPRWAPTTLLRQAPLNFLLMVPTALAAYLASWTGWFVTSGGYDRDWIASGGERWTGLLAWVPDALQNLWHWHADIYAFHNGLSVEHPYATPAILWPLLARPTQIYYRGSDAGENGCGVAQCSEIVWSIANPIIWWAAVAAAVYLVYRYVRRREWRVGLVLTGVAVGYLPWLLYPTRTMFQFYAIAFEPYLYMGLALALGLMLGLPLPGVRDARPVAWPAFLTRGSSEAGDAAAGDSRSHQGDGGDDAARLASPDTRSPDTARAEAGLAPDRWPSELELGPETDLAGADASGQQGSVRAGLARFLPSAWFALPVRRRFVVVFLVAAVLVSAFFYPLWTAMQTPFWFWTLHVWFPSWV